jgi:hypothetical protein
MILLEYRIQFFRDPIHITRREKFSGTEMELNSVLE